MRAASAAHRVRVGTDIVAVERLSRLLDEQPELSERVFTARELSYCAGRRRATEHLAARLAAKEAVLKALGTGLGTGMRWSDVEVVNHLRGRPQVRLRGRVAVTARRRGLRDIDVSLSHVAGLALATAVLVCEDDPAEEDQRWTG
jgi:holo-[acyl-carrier protein] synthase